MSIVVPDAGERNLLDRMVQGNNMTMKLYTAVSGGVVEGTVHTDFTEATFTGYAAKTLTPGGWSAAATNAGVTSKTYGTLQTFTRTSTGSAQTILGYYIVDATGGGIIYAEAFDTPVPVANNGDAINITPKIELS